jgi:hypothetical protein
MISFRPKFYEFSTGFITFIWIIHFYDSRYFPIPGCIFLVERHFTFLTLIYYLTHHVSLQFQLNFTHDCCPLLPVLCWVISCFNYHSNVTCVPSSGVPLWLLSCYVMLCFFFFFFFFFLSSMRVPLSRIWMSMDHDCQLTWNYNIFRAKSNNTPIPNFIEIHTVFCDMKHADKFQHRWRKIRGTDTYHSLHYCLFSYFRTLCQLLILCSVMRSVRMIENDK